MVRLCKGHTDRSWPVTALIAEHRLMLSVDIRLVTNFLPDWLVLLTHERNNLVCYAVSAACFGVEMCRHDWTLF